jgi:hypothetical protein
MTDLPAAPAECGCVRLQRQEADKLVTRLDPGVVSRSPNCAATSGKPPRNWNRGRTHHEERKVIDASAAAITLAMLLTDEEGIGKALLE